MIRKNERYAGFFMTVFFCLIHFAGIAQTFQGMTGAERTGAYLPLIRDRRVGFVANQTSVVGSSHLLDSLLSLGIDITPVFNPEHGFRGTADAGASINGTTDPVTGIPVVSLYGSRRKPTSRDLQGIDILIYDMQDIGARFYTYISTLHYVMEACAENHVPLIVLDRPNPNGHYVDGPVLEPAFRSFVGMHSIPVVHGMTVGELALMINGEGWLAGGIQCDLTVIPCSGYTHRSQYVLPVNPSPNITSMEAVYLYPSLCLFEGTVMNVGRGTDIPFRIFGNPSYPDHSFAYMPMPNTGNTNPLHNGLQCFGVNLTGLTADSLYQMGRINLCWLMAACDSMKMGREFFNDYFNTLAGTSNLKTQILEGWTEEEIRNSWQQDLDQFKQIRTKYLLYNDTPSGCFKK